MGVSCKLLLIKLSMHTMYITTHHADNISLHCLKTQQADRLCLPSGTPV